MVGWFELFPSQEKTIQTTSNAVYFYGEASDGSVWNGAGNGRSQLSVHVSSDRLDLCSLEGGGWSYADSGQRRVLGDEHYEVSMGRIDLSGDLEFTLNG